MSSERCLEFFFGEVPHFLGLSSQYPCLTKLTIVGQEELTSLRGLETLKQLRELWVVECGLTSISHLENAERLEKLYLYSNHIEAIEGLSRCARLTTLWLDDNRIASMSGLHLLPALRELNLAQNRISRLPDVDWGDELDWLNLSGNPVPLTDLPALARLPRLTELHLLDPTYRPAACASLCNFRLLIVQLLPRLQQLDGVPVSEGERAASRRQLAARLVYYRALCRHVRARCQEQVAQVHQQWHSFLAAMGRRLRLLQAKCLQVEAAVPAEDAAEPEVSRETLLAFRDALCRRMDCVASVARGQLAHSRERLDMLTRRRRLVQSLLELEFRTVGNICCEELNVSDASDGSQTLMLTQLLGRSRSSLSASKNVQLLAMYKVSNRFLEHRMVQKSASTKFARVLDRFVTSEQRQDIDWILETCKGNINTRVNVTADLDVPEEPNGGSPLASLREYFGGFREAVLVQVMALSHDPTKPVTIPTSLNPRSEELTSGNLVFAPKFVVLYTTAEFDNRSLTCLSSATLDDDLLNSVCLPAVEPTAMNNAEGAILKPAGVDSERVMMPGKDIAIIQSIENAPQIVELDLSFNELRSVQFLKNMLVLKNLNISYNYIKSIKYLPKLPCLVTLDMSWNRLDNLAQTMWRLSATCPQLKTLNIGFNPWFESEERQGKIAAVLLPGLRDLKGQNLFRSDPGAPIFRRFQSPMDIGDLCPPQPRQEMVTHLDPRRLTAVCLDGQMLQNLSCIKEILFLQKLSVNDNILCSLEGLEKFHHLEYLSADFNELSDFSGLAQASMKLRSLSVRHNGIASLESLTSVSLPALELLDVSANPVTSLCGADNLASLTELYVTAGRVDSLADLGCLARCKRLLALDASSNPVCAEPNYRRFVVFKCGRLRMLDGSAVDSEERAEAVGALSGLLSLDRLMETHSPPELHALTQLDLPGSGLRQIDLPPDCLQQVVSLNLEDNELTLLCGLQQLRKLRFLNLANNTVRRLRERTDAPSPAVGVCFPALQVLVLSGNGLVQLAPLQLSAMRALQSLFLQDNQIKALDSVARCSALQLLVADRNQLQALPAEALASLANLRALHVEGNRLRRLPAAWPPQLRALYLANNKLNEPLELTRLNGRVELRRVSLYKNPLSRNAKWQAVLCASQPTLQVLDGSPVTDVLGGGPGLDGDSSDEDEPDELHGMRGVWWRPQQAGCWSYRTDFG